MDEGSKMDDLRTRAHLVDFDRAGAIGTVVTRAEIAEAAAGTEFPATLLLDLDRVESDGGTTQARVAVDWDQETLQQLLASMEDPEFELRFDASELALAFDDVEGHGIRQKAAVLAVGVVAAGASATPAYARLASQSLGDGTVAPTTAVAPNPAGDKHAVLQGAERALQQDRDLSQNLGAPTTAVAPNPAADKAAVMQGAERALQQDQKLSQDLSSTQATVTSTDSGTLSTGELAGAVAGGALLIAAAGFGATRKRTPPAQPA